MRSVVARAAAALCLAALAVACTGDDRAPVETEPVTGGEVTQTISAPATIEAAARQYVRKVSGLNKGLAAAPDIFESAVAEVAATTTRLLAALPPRRQPPPTVPPLRRPEVQARIQARANA